MNHHAEETILTARVAQLAKEDELRERVQRVRAFLRRTDTTTDGADRPDPVPADVSPGATPVLPHPRR